MIAIEKQSPPLSVRLARVNVKMAQVTTIIGAATILTALLFAVLKTAILETILLVTLGGTHQVTRQVYRLEDLAAKINEKQPTCICGATLHASDIRHYGPQEGGIYLEGYTEPRWVYVTCSQCGYDMTIWKIWEEIQ